MMKIITLSGLDGSGKSTQIEKLRQYLEAKGQKVYYFHATAFSLPQKLRGASAGSGASKTSSSGSGVRLRKLVLPVDLLRFRRLLKKLDRQGYDVLVSDRYFYDTLVNIAFLEKSDGLIQADIPRPAKAFYLNADPKKIMARERAPDQGLEYLEAKQELYDQLAKTHKLVEINANQPPEQVSKSILEHL